jgi:magnesium-protoporphyrin IX monomethyl ester (oxidative) cyclase
MRFLAVHPGPLMYTKIFLRLEPLGLELVAAAVRRAGHDARLIDLQAATHADYVRLVDDWQPDVVAFSCNYLANVPEVVDLAKLTRARRPQTFVFVGGHSASFTAQELLEHAGGAIDCILKGEGEASVAELLEAVEHDRRSIAQVPGVVSARRR